MAVLAIMSLLLIGRLPHSHTRHLNDNGFLIFSYLSFIAYYLLLRQVYAAHRLKRLYYSKRQPTA